MKRIDVIQSIIDRKKDVNYLEIGVFTGRVFLRVKAKRKVAVDPEFKIPIAWKIKYVVRNPSNWGSKYFELTSDEFFEKHSDVLENGIDVAFVDGLHTYEQSLIDVENCLKRLNPGGFVIMHDCSPPSEAAAQKAMSPQDAAKLNHPDWNDEWTGDVYKALLHLRAAHDDLDAFVVDCDYGLGVVRRATPQAKIELSVDEIKDLTYAEFDKDRKRLLNLKTPAEFTEWVSTL